MLPSLPQALVALLFCSRSIYARPEPLAVQRRYLNTSAPAILPIATPTTTIISDELARIHSDAFQTTTAPTSPTSSSIAIPSTTSTIFTQELAAPTTAQDDPRPTDDELIKTDTGETKTESDVRTDEGEVKTDEGNTKTDEGETKTDEMEVEVTTISITRPPYATSRAPSGNYTYTLNGTTTQTTSCTTREAGEASTVYIILPNPTTITITLGGNYTTSLPSQVPEFTPPVFCPTPPPNTTTRYTPSMVPPTSETTSRKGTGDGGGGPETGVPNPGGGGPIGPPTSRPVVSGSPVTTVITTSKNPVLTFTSVAPPTYPSNNGGVKMTADPRPSADNGGNVQGGGSDVNSPGDLPQGGPQNDGAQNPPSDHSPQGSPSNPSQNPPVSGIGTGGQGVPDYGSGDQKPVVTKIRGVDVEIDPTQAIIGGTTVRFINPSQAAAVANGNGGGGAGGAGGFGVNGNAGAPANNIALPTNVVIVDGGIFSAIGSSIAVFDGKTINYNNGATITTDYHHEQITLAESITYDGTTMGGAGNIGTKLGIAGGISVTQVGPSFAVISSTSLTVGPQAVVTTVIIDQYTVIANTAGLEIDGTTLPHPFQPYTQYITVGDVTMTQIGSSLLVIEGTTFTIGGTSVAASSVVVNRQSITIASSSAISTITSEGMTTQLQPSATEPSPAAAATSSKSGGEVVRSSYTMLGIAMGLLYSLCI